MRTMFSRKSLIQSSWSCFTYCYSTYRYLYVPQFHLRWPDHVWLPRRPPCLEHIRPRARSKHRLGHGLCDTHRHRDHSREFPDQGRRQTAQFPHSEHLRNIRCRYRLNHSLERVVCCADSGLKGSYQDHRKEAEDPFQCKLASLPRLYSHYTV